MHPVPSIVRRPTIGLQRRHLPWDAGIQQWMRASVPRWRPGICATILSARRRVSTAGCRLVDDATFRPSATTRSYRTATALRIGHAGDPKRGPGAHPDRSLDRQCMGRPPSRGTRPAGHRRGPETSPRCTQPGRGGSRRIGAMRAPWPTPTCSGPTAHRVVLLTALGSIYCGPCDGRSAARPSPGWSPSSPDSSRNRGSCDMRAVMIVVRPQGWLAGSGRNGVTSRAVAALIVLILVPLVVAQSRGLFPQVPMLDHGSARGGPSR